MKKIVILSAGPGLDEIVHKYGHSSDWIPTILSDHNFDYSIKKVYQGDSLNIGDGDAWIITGSKYSVYEQVDWIKELIDFTTLLTNKSMPVLGICFGHQIIAKAVGANVIKNPLGWELGSYRLSLSDAGFNSPLFSGFKDNDFVYESHQDVVNDLPSKAIILANTKKSVQSFSYNNSYGVQFHPEFSWEVTRMLMDLRLAKGIKIDNDKLEKSINSHKILNNFVKIFKGDLNG